MNLRSLSRVCVTLALSLAAALPALALVPKRAPLMTRWAAQVDFNNPLPEYPRPQLVRSQWQSLNGVWQYQRGNAADALPTGQNLAGEICVPFPVQSALSGVMEQPDRLWYRRQFSVPSAWKGRELMLHFGAVDYEAEVFVNGKSLGVHTGGYEPFSYDISPYLNGDGPQELIVRVFDPTENGGQPRGKQTSRPGAIMYTATTGIWQTVWLEPVAKVAIESLHMVPDVDKSSLRMTVNTLGATSQNRVVVRIKDGGKNIKTVSLAPNVETAIPLKNPKLWSPDSPFLYDVSVSLLQGAKHLDDVTSYFGMRKISLGKVGGFQKLLLNNKFVFQMGPLDQGYWPDGLYTAPTDEALRFDLVATKRFGFNMVRKHLKVEPARWYYHADKLGLLVWQDMPSANSYSGDRVPVDKPAFETQLRGMVETHWNSPSIILWDLFNEGQGQFDTPRLVNMVKTLDPSRLVNEASGGGYFGAGEVRDAHGYPPPVSPPPSATQALACGEYGGVGLFVPGHTWAGGGGGYTNVPSGSDLEELYGRFSGKLKTFRDQRGMSAAVYTQITDVEGEINGLLTYDRLVKCDPAAIAQANRFRHVLPNYRELMPTSEADGQAWKYTTTAPAPDWFKPAFDDAAWKAGSGAYDLDVPSGVTGPRPSTSGDIWLRRTFNPGALNLGANSRLVLRDSHDKDIDVYLNGIPAYSAAGSSNFTPYRTLSDAARQSVRPNADNVIALRIRQDFIGQYVDVGLFERTPGTNAPASNAAPRSLSVGKLTLSSAEGASNEASYATDADSMTRWESPWADPQWLAVDLGRETVIDRAFLFWETARASVYEIQVSDDGKTWTSVASVNKTGGNYDAIRFNPVKTRWVRVYGTKRATGFGYSLYSFDVY